MSILDSMDGKDEVDVAGKTPPTQRLLDWFHGKADTRSPTSIHHGLGFGAGDAAPGNHTHDGKNSLALFKASDVPVDLTASPTNAQIAVTVNQILALLRKVAE